MNERSSSSLRGMGWPVMLIVAAKLTLHLISNFLGGYGYFRDELYYIACSEHPAFGYVDHPPLSIVLLILSRSIFGDSLFALRLLPALAGATTVLLAAMTARAMGGGIFARSVAALSALVSPVFLGMQTIYSMNAFDLLIWAGAAFLMVRIINDGTRRLWVALGIVLGLGLLNKISILFLGVGIAAGLVITRRSDLKLSGPWLCGLIALILFLPFVIWNIANDFAHLEFIRNASAGKYSGLTPLRFITDQFLINNPLTIPVWFGGLLFFFRKPGRKYRWLGISFAGAAVVLLMNQTSKAEYLAAGYTLLFAGGGVFWERILSEQWVLLRRVAYAILACGLLLAPFGLPILPVETYIRYAAMLGIGPSTSENLQMAELPQFYADMFGWEEQAKVLAEVYYSVPEEERKLTIVYGENYGRAGAIDFFGRKLGLPGAISGHNNYALWLPESLNAETVIMLDDKVGDKESIFRSVTIAGFYNTRFALPHENNLMVFICRDPVLSPALIRQRIRFYQ